MINEIRSIRIWTVFFMVALFVSGLTAMPVEKELAYLTTVFSSDTAIGSWIAKTYDGVKQTNIHYPFIAYGYDWLAFAHFALAILFIGVYNNPVRNKWIIEFAMIACILVIPFALIVGEVRGIPFWWRLIDCSFGVGGLVPLGICLHKINMIETQLNPIISNLSEHEAYQL